MTQVQPLLCVLGPGLAGLVGSVGYRARDPVTLAVRIARTTTGVVERLDVNGAATGVYAAAPTFDSAWGAVEVVWDVLGEAYAGVMAAELITPAGAAWGGVLDPAQAGALVRDAAAVLIGSIDPEAADHSATAFLDADDGTTVRVTSVNGRAGRIVTRH